MALHDPFARRSGSRRSRNRLSARMPATLQTISGTYSGTLSDLSVTGARFVLNDRNVDLAALRVGRDVVLKWASFEAFASIQWEARGVIGLQFKPPISPTMLLSTREADDERARYGSPGPASRV